MRRLLAVLTLLSLNASSILPAQKGADPTQRYFRLICLVHSKGSGKGGDPVVPEYVMEGTAVAQAAQEAAAASASAATNPQTAGLAPRATGSPGAPEQPGATAAPPMSSRPGILAWSMQASDDGKMAIIQIVAADHSAFDAILNDKRPEIRVFEIGKDKKDDIEKELQKFKKDFDLESFQVVAQ